jgi:hypothetical protein
MEKENKYEYSAGEIAEETAKIINNLRQIAPERAQAVNEVLEESLRNPDEKFPHKLYSVADSLFYRANVMTLEIFAKILSESEYSKSKDCIILIGFLRGKERALREIREMSIEELGRLTSPTIRI